MNVILIVAIAYIFASVTDAKIYERCELVRELHETHQLPQREAAMFGCIAEKHSLLDTSSLAGDPGTAQYHGLFQFSDEYWCSVNGEKKLCGGACESFRDDDISNDVYCAWYHVFVEHERYSGDGFDAWDANVICQKQLQKYLTCFNENLQSTLSRTKITTTTTKTTIAPKTDLSRNRQQQSKIYSRCELAKELYEIHDVEWEQLPTFICIASQHSGFKTNEVKVSNFDGTTNNGIFQISDKKWCNNGFPGKACNLDCQSLHDDSIADDVSCMKQIFNNGQDLSGEWTSYNECKEGDIWPYVEDCFIYDQSTETVVTPSTRTTTKPSAIKTTTKVITTRKTAQTTKAPSLLQQQRFQQTVRPLIQEDIIEPSRILLPPFEDEIEATTKLPPTTTTKRPQFPILKFFQQQFAPVTQKPVLVLQSQPHQPKVSFADIPDSSSLAFQSVSPRSSWDTDYDEIPLVSVSPFSIDYVKRITIPPQFKNF